MIGPAIAPMKHAIHDFSAKLRQPSVAPTLQAYVEWRRSVEATRETDAPAPPMPPIAPPPIAPRSISGTPKRAQSEHRMISAAPAIPMPPPSTKLCNATITGFGLR